MYRSPSLKRIYQIFKKICIILGKQFQFFRGINRALINLEKSIRLLLFTQEFLAKQDFRFTIIDGIKYPTVETIRKLHDYLVEKYQKDIDKIHKGELSLAPLEFYGIKYWMSHHPDSEEDIIIRGAHIFNKFLEEGHPFIDGNKRTGWATLWVFLAANDLIFFFPSSYQSTKQAEIVEKWAELEVNRDNIKEIIQWIKKYTRKRDKV